MAGTPSGLFLLVGLVWLMRSGISWGLNVRILGQAIQSTVDQSFHPGKKISCPTGHMLALAYLCYLQITQLISILLLTGLIETLANKQMQALASPV